MTEEDQLKAAQDKHCAETGVCYYETREEANASAYAHCEKEASCNPETLPFTSNGQKKEAKAETVEPETVVEHAPQNTDEAIPTKEEVFVVSAFGLGIITIIILLAIILRKVKKLR